jgi:hypothetical protein
VNANPLASKAGCTAADAGEGLVLGDAFRP